MNANFNWRKEQKPRGVSCGEVEGLNLDKSGGKFRKAALDQMDLGNGTEVLSNNCSGLLVISGERIQMSHTYYSAIMEGNAV